MKVSWLVVGVMVLVGMPLHAQEAAMTTKTVNIHDAADVERQVRTYFADAPVMAEIARCESKFRQFTDAGNVLRGGYGGGMIGAFQFNEYYHRATALSLGYDIDTLAGNMGYAKYVHAIQGTTPWNSSRACWSAAAKAPAPAQAVSNSAALTEAQQIAMLQAQISELLKLVVALQTQLAQAIASGKLAKL